MPNMSEFQVVKSCLDVECSDSKWDSKTEQPDHGPNHSNSQPSQIWTSKHSDMECCERVIAHDVFNRRRAWNIDKRIFTGAHWCIGISAVDNDLYVW